MEFSSIASRRRLIWANGLGTMLALGCASPGPPRSPSLHLPDFALNLEAQRVGDEVRLTWLTPAKTTDGIGIRGPIIAVVCREAGRIDATAKSIRSCDPVRRMAVPPGPAQMTDVLPHDLSSGSAKLLAYRVELLNGDGHSAGKSDAVSAAGGEAPAPMGSLAVSPRRGAALIQWREQPAGSAQGATIELRRTLVTPEAPPKSSISEPSAPPAVPTRRPTGALRAPARTPFSASKEPASEVTLTVGAAEQAPAGSADAGGTRDPTVRHGDTYVYVAQRVRKLTLNGESLEVRGAASPPITFTYRDSFPPAPPSKLVSVPSAGSAGEMSIDLSWEPSPESDLLGYNVYRQVGSGVFAKLNAGAVPYSSFRDMQVTLGHAYSYRVTSIDRRGNESAPSSEIHESLRQ